MSTTAIFAPVSAPAGTPLRLAMQRLWLTGRLLPAGARLVVQHTFRSQEDRPLEVIYSFPLPRDAALRAFRITGEGFEVHSELQPTEQAIHTYERGLAEGSLATLARLHGDGIVNLTVGNVRPGETVSVLLELLAGVELRDDGYRFRFPFTLAPGYHPQARTAVTGGEGEMELPAEQFGDVILPRFRKDASSLHEVGFDLSVAHELPIEEIGSPSHAIRVGNEGSAPARVALATGRDIPNRDLVLDVKFKHSNTQVLAGPSGNGMRAFAAIVPSTAFGPRESKPRRTVILLDRSGSMQGEPIAQARKAIEACLALLGEADSFGLVAFDNQIETLSPALLSGTREHRAQARAFLERVDARGGTELADGFLAAARLLERGGDVVILTDGQVAGTEHILDRARALNVRLSCLGIGSASQDRFLSLLARETGGVSRFVTARERVDLAAVDLFASLSQPVASGLRSGANVQPAPPQDAFAGTPVLLFGEAAEESPETIDLSWTGGSLSLPIPPGDPETGATLRLLRGSRLITDWESRYPGEEATAALERRTQNRVAARLVELSQAYGLASREMALVAVVKRMGDRAGELPETRVVPVGMPQDTAFGAYFHDRPDFLFGSFAAAALPSAPLASALFAPPQAPAPPPSAAPRRVRRSRMKLFSQSAHEAEPTSSVPDPLFELAAMLEPDGGMPGADLSERAARTIAAVLAFVAAGHTLGTGAFRSHLARLVGFLCTLGALSPERKMLVDRARAAAAMGEAPAGDWTALALASRAPWKEIGRAFPVA